MSENLIPEHIDPLRCGEQALSLTGVINLGQLSRLRLMENIAHKGLAHVKLQFGMDEQGINWLRGHIDTSLKLVCQRCLEDFDYEIISDFVLGIVADLEAANQLPKGYEPVMTKDGKLSLHDLVEDEVILNLPIIPKHALADCKVTLPLTDEKWDQQKKNPFQVLEGLKRK